MISLTWQEKEFLKYRRKMMNSLRVFVDKESGAISWPEGIEIDTLSAYCSIKGISPDKYFNRQINHGILKMC